MLDKSSGPVILTCHCPGGPLANLLSYFGGKEGNSDDYSESIVMRLNIMM